MKVFLYEAVCAGALGFEGFPSLRREGRAMLWALCQDFQAIGGVQVLTLLDHSLLESLGWLCQRIRPEEEEKAFREFAARADYTLPIAPEFGGVLATRTRWVLEAGGCLLNSLPPGVDLAGDKIALAERLKANQVLTPPVFQVPNPMPQQGKPNVLRPEGDLVLKPRHGAGSMATFFIKEGEDLSPYCQQAVKEMPDEEFLLQPFVPGLPVSMAFLIGPYHQLALVPAYQDISLDGRFRYLGGRWPLPETLAERATNLASRAIQAVPGLQGYVGVDMILGDLGDLGDHDTRDYVLDINPRLTTSYLGLRELAKSNLAESLLRIVRGEKVSPLQWHGKSFRFFADE